jgi:hypothetical protein
LYCKKAKEVFERIKFGLDICSEISLAVMMRKILSIN